MQKLVNGTLVEMSAEEIAAREAEIAAMAAAPLPVPASVRMWQARAVLSAAGHLATVDAAIANSGNAAWQAAWEYAPEISRASALVNQMAALLGLTSEQVDQMFRDGAALAV